MNYINKEGISKPYRIGPGTVKKTISLELNNPAKWDTENLLHIIFEKGGYLIQDVALLHIYNPPKSSRVIHSYDIRIYIGYGLITNDDANLIVAAIEREAIEKLDVTIKGRSHAF